MRPDRDDYGDNGTYTLALIDAIYDRVVDAPLFPVGWFGPDASLERGILEPGRGNFSFQLPLLNHPAQMLDLAARAVDDRRLELRFRLNGIASRPLVYELVG
jgi:hypothetical protein